MKTCGCYVHVGSGFAARVTHCRLHEAAPVLLAALQRIEGAVNEGDGRTLVTELQRIAREAIRACSR